jgi:hypothetical protein
VPLALQQSMPLAQVLSVMAKPPGSAPPFMPRKPVPRLVPLPGSHTLAVARPELRDAALYGNLRADNLQLSITAQVGQAACPPPCLMRCSTLSPPYQHQQPLDVCSINRSP